MTGTGRGQRPDGQPEQHVHDREQRAVRVRERPHESSRFVRDVEVRAHLEAVQRFDDQPERGKDEQRPPAKPQVTIELALDGKVLGRQSSALPDPNAAGTIPLTIAAPAKPGKNRLRITVQQGSESVERLLEYSVETKVP